MDSQSSSQPSDSLDRLLSLFKLKRREYEYLPLPTEESFRLLELLPGTGRQKLEYRLVVAEIGRAPPYEAISYCWGDPTPRVDTMCNGKHLKIAANLGMALRSFRLPDRCRTLWADAVCINQQGNVAERSQQVQRMRKIYQNACLILVWLGDGDDEKIAKAFELVDIISNLCCRKASISTKELAFVENLRPIAIALKPDDIPVPTNGVLFKSLTYFFKAQWFGRLWVVQEVTAGPGVMVKYSHHERNWEVVSLTAVWIDIWSLHESHLNDLFYGSQKAAMMRKRHRLKPGESPTASLDLLSKFKTTDPKDKVFAILGLPLFANIQVQLSVDYAKPTSEIYRDFILAIINDRQSLSALRLVSHQDEVREDLPSWVPDFSRACSHNGNLSKFGAAHQFPFKGLERPDENSIRSSALEIDAVVEIQDITRQWFIADATFAVPSLGLKCPPHPFLTMWDLLATKSSYPTGETSTEAYAKTLTLGERLLEGGNFKKQKPETYLSEVDLWVARLRHYACNSVDNSLLIPEQSRTKYALTAHRMSRNRTFFRTAKGYFGVGPRMTRPGDWIFVLRGSRSPCLLRRKGEDFQLIGASYLHGIMDGEAVEMCKAGKLKVAKVTIR
ncbi:HET-domain-containing protein [Lophium mytilinum]|uniref:HET-domain-containing protein n=1 Tax=Lophium mytilinum TaxID=390894 RepID=A0A6A6R5I1_9PEZI|nr:HET-domain-containing protein [Lophium mytilinum]